VEKLSWANGDGAGLRVVSTDIGRLGVLICGENTNPLARFALLAQGEQIHIASYPPAFPFRRPGQARNYDLRQAILIRAGAHSFEGKVFTVVASGVVDERTLQEVCGDDQEKRGVLVATHHPLSVVINPNGEVVGGPLEDEEGIVTAEIDVAESIEWKQVHDITGGYNRFDVFQLRLNTTPNQPLSSGVAEFAAPEVAHEALEPLLAEESPRLPATPRPVLTGADQA
jgi:predicted amidohydrolase